VVPVVPVNLVPVVPLPNLKLKKTTRTTNSKKVKALEREVGVDNGSFEVVLQNPPVPSCLAAEGLFKFGG